MQLFIHRILFSTYSYTFLLLISNVWFERVFACLGPYCRMLFHSGFRRSLAFYNCGALLPAQCCISLHWTAEAAEQTGLLWGVLQVEDQAKSVEWIIILKPESQLSLAFSGLHNIAVFLCPGKVDGSKSERTEKICSSCRIPHCSVANTAFVLGKLKLAEAGGLITQEYKWTLQLHFNLSVLMLVLEAGCYPILPSRGNTLRHRILNK